MQFNNHFNLSGKHAFLSASKYSWLRYDLDKLDDVYRNHQAAMQGTRFHELAAELIRLGVKLPRSSKTLNNYVNDAIGYRMTPEQVLFYSDNVFGTADAISFRKNILRISDLKNGVTKASFDQLKIYAAMFCHEYRTKPNEIEMELRLYQSDEMLFLVPEADEISVIMDTMKIFDDRIEELKAEAEGAM